MLELVTAVIKPHKLEEVKEALVAAGIQGVTISEVRGFGRQGGKTEVYRGSEYAIDFIPKIRIEVVVPATEVRQIVDLIVRAARTGRIGDGKVWSMPIGSLTRVRTGETGLDAV